MKNEFSSYESVPIYTNMSADIKGKNSFSKYLPLLTTLNIPIHRYFHELA